MDKRLRDIRARLGEYAVGKFSNTPLDISPALDEVDAIITGINIMGEELKAVSISRDYFNNIFNSVSDMVFVLNTNGNIVDMNQSAIQQLGYDAASLKKKNINDLFRTKTSYFKKIIQQVRQNKALVSKQCCIYNQQSASIPVSVNASFFKDDNKKQLILLTATDITFQQKAENLIIRAIIDTQEKERQRLAQDFHDGIAQQLSGIKFFISATANAMTARKHRSVLIKSNDALTEVISDMRNICFNLMPKTLEQFGLVKAVREFWNNYKRHTPAEFSIMEDGNVPDFFPELKIDLYRVIQEFINNALKHGGADKIQINLMYKNEILKLLMNDNGIGFNIKNITTGMGLQNVRSRVKSHHGEVDISSAPGRGTSYKITIPLNN